MKKIVLLAIVVLCALSLLSCAKESEGLEFELNDDGESYSVAGIGTCTDTDIVIPSTYEGKPVTIIGNNAFTDCNELTSIIIPDSVTSINFAAFSFCAELMNIEIPNSVTSIGGGAFYGCKGLTSVIFDNPDGWSVNDGSTIINKHDLSDPSIAAKYLTDTYKKEFWIRY